MIDDQARVARRLDTPPKLGRFRTLPETELSDPEQQPAVDVSDEDIEPKLKHGAVWALGSQVGVQVIRFLSVIVLARLLAPEDYGAAYIAVTIGAFAFILGDLGYGTALVQASAATQRWASTAYWSALGAGVLGTTIAALVAFPSALALDTPEVTGLVIAGGFTLMLVGAGSASHALLMRSMSFAVIQSAILAATLVAAASAITAAAMGAGAWALVLQQIVYAAANSALFIVAARWHPSFAFSPSAFRWLSKFALPVTGGHVFGITQPLVMALLIGHLLGVNELGVWSLSMAVVVVPLSLLGYPVARVMYAAFARMRDTPERIAEVWLNGLTLLSAVVLPTLFGLIAVAPDLVPLAFGPQWEPAVTVIQILAVFIIARTLQTWNTPVMDSLGKPHISTILNACLLVALAPSVWLGSQFGLAGAAIAYSLAALVCGEIPSFVITTRALRLRGLTVLRRLRGVAVAAAITCASVIVLRQALATAGTGVELRVALSVISGALIYAAALTLLARQITNELLQIARGLGPRLRTQR